MIFLPQQKLYIPECSSHGFIIHIRFVFVLPPQPGYCFRIYQLKNAFFPLGPFDVFRTGSFVLEQSQ
jgi:hypothetical protein